MLGKITEIVDNQVFVELSIDMTNQMNLINIHVIFENGDKKIVGEIVSSSKTVLKANIVGEIKEKKFTPGSTEKPSFKSLVRIITMEELELVLGSQTLTKNETYFGISNIYENYRINVDTNGFFSNHFAILGNSGAGKSFTVSRLFQNIFATPTAPVGANIFMFDAYGEYSNAFKDLEKVNPNIHYKTYTTNTHYADTDIIQIPLWLLDVDDLALLLDVTTPSQLPIIEKALHLVPILTGTSEEVIKQKNSIIAKALLDILLSGKESTKIRDQLIAVLTKFHTSDLSLETQIVQPGYTRTFKQCLYIDKMGKLQEMELVVSFLNEFIIEDTKLNPNIPVKTSKDVKFSLQDLEMAMDFALISEGILKSDKVYDSANILSVRLHSLVESPASVYFDCKEYMTRSAYISKLLTHYTGTKCQIVNFNINYVDDRLAKVITKIISKILFSYAVENPHRGSVPFHIIIEEAHRYVQNDHDIDIIGYNIFDRITKEGRKYGVLLGLITQRPCELSDTAISQCSNFIILRILHPKDLEYIKNMVPDISKEVVEQLKSLKPGNCIAFGQAFKLPISMHFEKPNPEPLSNNVDIASIWYTQK